MIEMSRLSRASFSDLMGMALRDLMLFREALANVLERERAARDEAR